MPGPARSAFLSAMLCSFDLRSARVTLLCGLIRPIFPSFGKDGFKAVRTPPR